MDRWTELKQGLNPVVNMVKHGYDSSHYKSLKRSGFSKPYLMTCYLRINWRTSISVHLGYSGGETSVNTTSTENFNGSKSLAGTRLKVELMDVLCQILYPIKIVRNGLQKDNLLFEGSKIVLSWTEIHLCRKDFPGVHSVFKTAVK